MKFQTGKEPQWRPKPKTSPLDADAEFIKLRAKVLSGTMKPMEQAGLYVDPSDGQRLGTRNPARLVRDRLRRILEETNLVADFDITCRQTAELGVWAVWVTYLPRETATQPRRRAAGGNLLKKQQEAEAAPVTDPLQLRYNGHEN